jgi:hypothetical protein
LAKSSSDRRAIEQRLIDLQFAEEKLKNQYVIDWAERVRLNKDATDKEKADAALAAAIAKMHQATADDRHANATYGNQQSNASPLQDYFNQIPDTASEINDAFESIAVHGLATFNDALTNAIVHFTSLRDVARTVLQTIAADMIKLALQQIELHTIGAALGAASTATTTALAAAAGAAWAGPAAMASLGAPKAVGGRIFGPGSDTSDNILTPSSPGEFMIRASSARSIGYDALEYMNQAGEMPGGLAMGGPVRPINATASRGGSGGGLDRADIGRLETAIRESQQSISLYASLDPVDMLQRALGRPAGHRALMAHLGNNATAVKATLDRP